MSRGDRCEPLDLPKGQKREVRDLDAEDQETIHAAVEVLEWVYVRVTQGGLTDEELPGSLSSANHSGWKL